MKERIQNNTLSEKRLEPKPSGGRLSIQDNRTLRTVQSKMIRDIQSVKRTFTNSAINPIIQREIISWGTANAPEGGQEGQFYSTECKKWFPNKRMAELAEASVIRTKAVKKRPEPQVKRISTSTSATKEQPVEPFTLPEIPKEEIEPRKMICDEIIRIIAEEKERTHPSTIGPVETPVFTGEIRRRLTPKLTYAEIKQTTDRLSLVELRELFSAAYTIKQNWPARNRFVGHTDSYDTFSPSPEYTYDLSYSVTMEELAFWNRFLDRDIVLGDTRIIPVVKEQIRHIHTELAKKDPNIQSLIQDVKLNPQLKAARMELSNTVVGAGTEASRANRFGSGDKETTEEAQWIAADGFMMDHVNSKETKIGMLPSVLPQLSPEFILKINQMESSNKGVVNSQAAGELRFSSIALGGKGEVSHNLSLVPPSMIAISLAGLINGINEQLTHIQSTKDIWEILPIVGRFYTDFLSIHPFPDGNGRTARKVVDFLLLSFGLPPAQFDNRSKNFGAGIPEDSEELTLERPFDDLAGVTHVLNAVSRSFKLLLESF